MQVGDLVHYIFLLSMYTYVVYIFHSIYGWDVRTSVVLPAPCTPFRPRKNGGGFGFEACRAWCACSRSSRKGMQCWDLSSMMSGMSLSLSRGFFFGQGQLMIFFFFFFNLEVVCMYG